MAQTRKQSLFEASINIVIGFILNLLFQVIIYRVLHIKVSISQNLMIGAYFTGISLARTYLVRRIFNRIHK